MLSFVSRRSFSIATKSNRTSSWTSSRSRFEWLPRILRSVSFCCSLLHISLSFSRFWIRLFVVWHCPVSWLGLSFCFSPSHAVICSMVIFQATVRLVACYPFFYFFAPRPLSSSSALAYCHCLSKMNIDNCTDDLLSDVPRRMFSLCSVITLIASCGVFWLRTSSYIILYTDSYNGA
ncbi:hypothetical protein C8J56DRAFT_360918 [Mycena floridula]|nr:hypothetical protein C8J56DRAFT_360918 [Mycena floridula]